MLCREACYKDPSTCVARPFVFLGRECYNSRTFLYEGEKCVDVLRPINTFNIERVSDKYRYESDSTIKVPVGINETYPTDVNGNASYWVCPIDEVPLRVLPEKHNFMLTCSSTFSSYLLTNLFINCMFYLAVAVHEVMYVRGILNHATTDIKEIVVHFIDFPILSIPVTIKTTIARKQT